MLRARSSALLLIAALAAGCGHRAAAPPAVTPTPGAPTPPAGARAGYDGSSGYRADLDVTALRDRRILLDPGHGGRWAGSRGVENTREADVNLRVALALTPLLRRTGATVFLTRETDTTLAVGPDTSLATDLRLRARMADSLGVDVFLSLHHNADAGARHDVNETQIYYRTGDEGPSLDLASRIYRRMVQGLRIGAARLLPGNYAVLRQTHVPAAVLGEASYLTYPPVEKILADSAATRLEAESYFMGLLDYFRDGVPRVVSIAWDTTWSGADAWRPLRVRYEGEAEATRLVIDGRTVTPSTSVTSPGDASIRYAPDEPWRDGAHAISAQIRNAAGNHSAAVAETLVARVPATQLDLEVRPQGLRDGGTHEMHVTARDAWGRMVADTVSVADIKWSAPSRATLSHLRWLPTPSASEPGEARAYFEWTSRPSAPQRLTATWKGLKTVVELPVGRESWTGGFVRRPDGVAVSGAQVTASGGSSSITNEDGFYVLPGGDRGPLTVDAPGYVDLGRMDGKNPVVAPVVQGALIGKRITIDPEGGGDESGGEGQNGLRGASINLQVARLLRDDLERAGAAVVLTREGDASVSALSRVQTSERFRADRFVRVGRRLGGPTAVGFFPSSAGGRALAGRVHRRMWTLESGDTLGGDSTRAARKAPVLLDDANYVLQQTSVPSISVRVGDLATPEGEARFADPAWRHREAYAIFLALAEEFGAPTESSVTARIRLTEPAARARLDGIPLLPDARGDVRFSLLDPKVPHRLEVGAADGTGRRAGWIDVARSREWIWAPGNPLPTPEASQPTLKR